MSVPESIAWLQTSVNSKSPSMAKVYATTILGELERLSGELDRVVRELDERERLRSEAVDSYRGLRSTFDELEERSRAAREQWDSTRVDLETRLRDSGEKLNAAEGILKDVHYALLHQPELTREEIANVITSVVKPHTKGSR